MKSNSMKRILVLSANPLQTERLRLDEEVREIDNALQRAQKRDQFDLKSRWAVTPRGLQLAVLEEKPQIVHFCGHGVGEGGLVLEDEAGQSQLISTAALSGLFKLFADQVECVLLSACYSEIQAEEICQHIGYVIGMNQPIGDRAAIEFAFGFYSALGNGRSYSFAYEFGCNSIRSANIPQADVPVLKQRSLQITLRELSLNTLPSLWIQGLGQIYGDSVIVELDWTSYFLKGGRRQNPDQSTWDNKLSPDLEQVKEFLTRTYPNECIDLRAKLPLPAMLAIGATFPDLAYQLQYEQTTDGEPFLWRSKLPTKSTLQFKVIEEKGQSGKNLLIAFAIGGSAQGYVATLYQQAPGAFDALVYTEPEIYGRNTTISNADAIALAINAKNLMRLYRQKYNANCIHLIMLAPAAFALFLGQRLNTLGEIVSYEWTTTNGYQVAVKLQVGG